MIFERYLGHLCHYFIFSIGVLQVLFTSPGRRTFLGNELIKEIRILNSTKNLDIPSRPWLFCA